MADPKRSHCGVGFRSVLERELAYAQRRWRAAYGGDNHGRKLAPAGDEAAPGSEAPTRPWPTTEHGLVGLAFSGGGIRSATINMGIAQALHRRGVFDHVDYMSTVSGGGYLGSSISTAMRRLPDDDEKEMFPEGKGEFPFALDAPQGDDEEDDSAAGSPVGSPFLTWVRNNSNYMATGGFLDFARIGGVLLRGILVNFLVLLPILLVLAVYLSARYQDELTEWNAYRTWNEAVAEESEAQAARAEARRTSVEGGAEAVRAKEAVAVAWGRAGEAWQKAATAAEKALPLMADRAKEATAAVAGAETREVRQRALAAAAEAERARTAAEERAALAGRLTLRQLGSDDAPEVTPFEEPSLGSFFTIAPAVAGLFVFLAFVFPVLIRVYKVYKHGELLETGEESSVASRSQVEMAFAYTLAAIGLFVLIEALPIVIHYFHHLRDAGWRGTMAGAASGGALAAITAAGRVLSSLGGLRQKLALLAVGLLGLVIPLVVVLYATEGLVYGSWGTIETFQMMTPLQFAWGLVWPWYTAPAADATNSLLWLLPGILLIIIGGGLGSALVGRLWKQPSKPRTMVSLAATLAGAAGGYWLIHAWSGLLKMLSGGPAGVSAWAYVVGSAAVIAFFCWLAVDVNLTGVLGLYRDRLASAYLIGRRKKKDPRAKPIQDKYGIWTLPLEKDEHGRPTGATEIFIEPDLNLEDLCGSMPPAGGGDDAPTRFPSKAPYHIVNTSLNLQGSKDPLLRDRNSDFLMFSKYYYGGDRTGYCRTRDLEKVFPQMDLPTAMAISAAAASPNSGRMTNKPLVALMTLFNIRLGYWVPHPGRLCEYLAEKPADFEPQLHHRFSWRIPPSALLREMVSAVNEEHKWVNLSDGGHIENMAVYELLRRRCKYIICGDGEADPNLTFGGLATLMRFARIDMGIEIEILLDDLRLDETGKSHQHAAFGRIVYPAHQPVSGAAPGGCPECGRAFEPCEVDSCASCGCQAGSEDAECAECGTPFERYHCLGKLEHGYLLYIKSSFTGNEDETMQEYRAQNPAFPHESTADQFFDEGQFEAYRALGFHMADGLFPRRPGKPLKTFEKWADFTDWFERLEADLAPRLSAKYTALQDQLRRIQKQLRRPDYRAYFYELRGEREAADEARTEAKEIPVPDIMYVVGLQMALMEDAFLSLNLDQPQNWRHEGNRGWRQLFKQWWRSETFQVGYLLNIDRHSGRFKNFCERYLPD